jgi:proline iminopeptidase
MLDVSDGHKLYWETSGNPHGFPALFLHGGPGSGTSPKQRRFFDPASYRIVLFDQRGSGKSEPFASLEHNTTPKLVEDIEALRVHLGVDKWLVFGGSWGSTLALAYAQAHPDRVASLVLRGIFLLRRSELKFFYQEGSSWLFPDAWEAYLAPIPVEERGELIAAYHKRLTSEDASVRAAACVAWSTWEGRTSKLLEDAELVGQFSSDRFAESLARIECHYFVNGGFMEEGALLGGIDAIRHIPTVIVQGRYDVVCPAKSAWDLHTAWPEAKFEIIPDSGHSAFDVGIQKALLDAVDSFRP